MRFLAVGNSGRIQGHLKGFSLMWDLRNIWRSSSKFKYRGMFISYPSVSLWHLSKANSGNRILILGIAHLDSQASSKMILQARPTSSTISSSVDPPDAAFLPLAIFTEPLLVLPTFNLLPDSEMGAQPERCRLTPFYHCTRKQMKVLNERICLCSRKNQFEAIHR